MTALLRGRLCQRVQARADSPRAGRPGGTYLTADLSHSPAGNSSRSAGRDGTAGAADLARLRTMRREDLHVCPTSPKAWRAGCDHAVRTETIFSDYMTKFKTKRYTRPDSSYNSGAFLGVIFQQVPPVPYLSRTGQNVRAGIFCVWPSSARVPICCAQPTAPLSPEAESVYRLECHAY